MLEILLELKKPIHVEVKPWEIVRIGVDFKLKCSKCGHVIVLPREKATKIITKKIVI